ncbi:NAD(+) diphosphatase [Hyphococcus flavus]|uniref:NAD(+) diphosphatase n=1 Tax=Hyphococcus flavus TaxID=1866326 RepID=A0AAE9ZGY0_9PROT|nr:NAD(+) diphosphatase [Hyphococcus flavus]WDI32838.1 NAD(+) diphosphatase [Hyphococcus flavus]
MRARHALVTTARMKIGDNPNWFAGSPLERVNNEKDNDDAIAARLKDPDSLLIPLWRGDPLVANGAAAFLSAAAFKEFPADAPIAILGMKNGAAYFAIDASGASASAEEAPFSDIGEYMNLRMAAGIVSRDDLAIIGHARWLFEWRRQHRFCANCGGDVAFSISGAKADCRSCEAEHFPRVSPVAIVLAVHEDHCLLGRGPHFPEGMLSALAGFIEAGETPEEAARREIFEEAGVALTDIRYQFSQPWPFPSSLMMGFLADAEGRTLNLDTEEIVEARWISLEDTRMLLDGEERGNVILPPKFTIARQLLERWAAH